MVALNGAHETGRVALPPREDVSMNLGLLRASSLLVIFRFYVLGPTRFRPEPGSNPISTTVTMLNKILFGLLKFYFTLKTDVKKPPTPFSNFPHGTILLQSHHPAGSLQYFTSHYFTLQKMLNSRAF